MTSYFMHLRYNILSCRQTTTLGKKIELEHDPTPVSLRLEVLTQAREILSLLQAFFA